MKPKTPIPLVGNDMCHTGRDEVSEIEKGSDCQHSRRLTSFPFSPHPWSSVAAKGALLHRYRPSPFYVE
jgi:hypothetical protein